MTTRNCLGLSAISLAVGAVLILGMPRVAADELVELRDFPTAQEVRQIKAEISLLNLLNGLYLSQEQIDQLVPLAEKAVATRRSYLRQFDSESSAYISRLSDFRDALYAPTGSPPEMRHAVARAEYEIEIHPRDAAAEELGRIEDQARAVLNDAQIAIIEDFKPCLIPPKNLADPVAVGQASTTDKEELLLDVVRRMPEDLYAQQRSVIANAVIKRGEIEKGAFPSDVRQNMLETYWTKLDEVRGMSAVDFELHKSDLAKSFQLFDDDVTYRKGHTREPGPISRHLLNETGARVLKRWREARAGDAPSTPALPRQEVDPQGRREAFVREGLMRFGRQTQILLEERRRSGQLSAAAARQLNEKLLSARDMSSMEEQFRTVCEVCDRLNRVAVTPRSVDAAFLKVAGLAHLKGVPGIVGPPQHPREIQDVTGLAAQVRLAQNHARFNRFQEAYAVLSEVAATLEQFREQ